MKNTALLKLRYIAHLKNARKKNREQRIKMKTL